MLDDEEGDALEQFLNDKGVDEEILWGIFYHGTIDVEDVAEIIRPLIEPGKEEVAAATFKSTLDRAPGSGPNALLRETFHGRLTSSLTILTTLKSPAALEHAANLLVRYPDKTQSVANYLAALCATEPERVIATIEDVLGKELFLLGWQVTWLLRTLQCGSDHVSDETLEWATGIAEGESNDWLARVEAAKVLSKRDRLPEDLLRRMWELSPQVHRSDLVEALHTLAPRATWAAEFLEVIDDDPVVRVVLHRLRAEAGNTE